jgi:hypothetical protein
VFWCFVPVDSLTPEDHRYRLALGPLRVVRARLLPPDGSQPESLILKCVVVAATQGVAPRIVSAYFPRALQRIAAVGSETIHHNRSSRKAFGKLNCCPAEGANGVPRGSECFMKDPMKSV